MPREVISSEIFKKILDSPKTKSMNKGSIRNAISSIHKDNPGITMNAAAYEFARRKQFGLYRYLSHDDKLSLQHLKVTGSEHPVRTGRKSHAIHTIEIKPDFESPFISEANNNGSAYPYVYILENTLRAVIFERFGNQQDWWKNEVIVNKDIQEYATRIQQAEQKYPWIKERGDHPIYYVGLLELFKIIEKNWKLEFRHIFDVGNFDLEQLRTWIKECIPIRNLIAHNVRTREQERQNIRMKTDYICTVVEKWRRKKAES